MITHGRSKRKPTGGLYHKLRKKRKNDIGSDFLPVKIGERKVKKVATLGGNFKMRVTEIQYMNLVHGGTTEKAKIITVKENPANPHYVRMNIITKGAVVETDKGLARVTSRPGQHGAVNGVLLK